MKRICAIPGTFDPATNGHADIIARASALFDEVVVAVLKNSQKTPLFTVDERVAMLKKVCEPLKNVRVDSFDGLTVDFCKRVGACAVVRGLRAVSDFEYEFQMASLNRHMSPEIESVFLMTDTRYTFLSSSMVKEIGRLSGDISALVPEAVAKEIIGKLKSC